MLSFKNVCALSILLAGQLQAGIPGYVEQKLTLNDMSGNQAYFGGSVAVSSDGRTLVIGAPFDSYGLGAVAIFKLQQDGFHQYGSKLLAENTISSMPCVGHSVAISADGNRIAAGAPYDNNNIGAVFIFDYDTEKATWEQTTKIVSTNVIGSSVYQGHKVALSADGSTLAFTGYGDNNGLGAAWVYDYDGLKWNEQTKLIGTEAIGQANQGASIAISSDGNTIAIGADGDEQNIGASYVFTRNDKTWVQSSTKLRCSDITDAAQQGSSIILSHDSKTLLIGAPSYNNKIGTTCRLMRSGSQWFQQGKLEGAGATEYAYQGQSLALSEDNKILLIGAPHDSNGQGAIWNFNQIDGATWIQQGTKITDAFAFNVAEIGHATAISSKGETLVIGAPVDRIQKGSVLVYYKPLPEESGKDYHYSYWVPPLIGLGGSIISGLILWRLKTHIKKWCCPHRKDSMQTILLDEPPVSFSIDEKA